MPIRYREWICQLGNWTYKSQCSEEDLESDWQKTESPYYLDGIWIYEIEWAHPKSEDRKKEQVQWLNLRPLHQDQRLGRMWERTAGERI